MAVSQTGSIHPDWLQYRHHALAGKPPVAAEPHHHALPTLSHVPSLTTTESTVVSTPWTTPVTGATTSPRAIISGRIGKSARKRSRTSRKPPTTLLSTDTTNFRAMVQQFTGVPSGQFPTTLYQPGGPTLDFELGVNHFHHSMIPPFAVHHHHQQQQQNCEHYQQFQQLQEHQHQRDVFLHGFLNNPRRSANHEIISDGFHLESISTDMMPNSSSPSSSGNRRTTPGIGSFLL